MKLSTNQQLLLVLLNKPYKDHERHHPVDAYNTRTVEALLKHKLIEKYQHRAFLHGALRLTSEGKRVMMNDGDLG